MKTVIDISQFNGTVDWNAVKNAVDGAIIRVGYRGYGASGALVKDARCVENLKGAAAAGVPLGVYFLTQAVTEAEAAAEAEFVHKIISGFALTYPVYLDSEWSNLAHSGRADGIGRAKRTDCAAAFCEKIAALGYVPGVYASESWFADMLEFDRLSGYSIWVAKYADNAPSTVKYDGWQYTDAGAVPGVSGKVDISRFEEAEEMTEQRVREIVMEILRGEDTKVSNALAPELAEAVEKGITDGTRPGGYATRAQVAVMALRASKQ